MDQDLHVHGTKEQHATYSARSLQRTFPQLLDFLRPAMRVLDVGCGPGSITLDVGECIATGAVIGVDTETASIERARELARERKVTNAEFQVQDACKLSFKDSSFDLTYSHALFDWLLDPVGALKEQRRVTRPQGWVCAMMTTHNTAMMYPQFPSLWTFFQSWRYWADPANPTTFYDRFVGRRSVELFKTAGFSDLVLKGMEPRIWHSGQSMEHLSSLRLFGRLLAQESEIERRFIARLIQIGAVNEWILERAREEWQLFIENPYALYVQINLFAAAQVQK